MSADDFQFEAVPYPAVASQLPGSHAHLFQLIGLYQVHWSSFELAVDIGTAKITNEPEAEVVRRTIKLTIADKVRDLIQKAEQSSHPNRRGIIDVLNKLPDASIRNVVAHSYMRFGDDRVIFIHRDRKGRLRRVDFTATEFRTHLATVSGLAHALTELFANTDADAERYLAAFEAATI